jgi:hypothetical protein
LAAPVLLSLILAAATAFGWFAAVLFLLLSIVLITVWSFCTRARDKAICLLVSLVPVAFLWSAISGFSNAKARTLCSANLKQIGFALRSYHDVYRTFPPAYVADEDGRPMHSWRVLILPFTNQQALYKQLI